MVGAAPDGPLARLPRGAWLVTGANGLLSSTIAARLDAEGLPLLLHLHHRTKRVTGLKQRHPAVEADLATVAGRVRLIQAASRLGLLGGLLLGASNFRATPPSGDPGVSPILRLDLEAPLDLALRLAPRLAPGGRIILFSDAGTALGWPSYPVYLAAKGGLEAATRSLARRLGPRLVVLCAAPGALEGAPPPPDSVVLHLTPLARLGTPAETAEAILRFAALPPSVCHGACLSIDGGRRLTPDLRPADWTPAVFP